MWDYIQFWLAGAIVDIVMILIFALLGAMLMTGYLCYKKMTGDE
jgi:nicotinamide riboside transporter PnuC